MGAKPQRGSIQKFENWKKKIQITNSSPSTKKGFRKIIILRKRNGKEDQAPSTGRTQNPQNNEDFYNR